MSEDSLSIGVQAEAEKFLTECVKAARSYIRLNDPKRAVKLMADAISWISRWHEEMDRDIEARAPTIAPAAPEGRRGGVA